MTHHNQTKELTLGFSISPLMSPLTKKGTKFEALIQDPMKYSWKTKSQQKAQEGHLEEGKPQKPTKGKKSGKITKRARKAENQSKSSKSTLPPKINSS
jgi:phage protein D